VAYSLHASSATRKPLETRLLGEFHEMPGLSLTADQAAKLFGISQGKCAELLEDLADRGLLQRTGARYGLCGGRL